MPTNSDPFEASERLASGPRKQTLSTKAANNGDLQAEKKQQKLAHKAAPPAKATTIPSKATTKWHVAPVKPASWCPFVKIEDIDEESDCPKSNPPHNPRCILEVTDSSDDEVDDGPTLELIEVEVDQEKEAEAVEESAEAELSMFHYTYGSAEHWSWVIEWLSKDWNSLIYVFFRKTPQIEYTDGCRAHVFECAAGKCRGKNGQDVHQFLGNTMGL